MIKKSRKVIKYGLLSYCKKLPQNTYRKNILEEYSLALPAILYGTSVMPIPDCEIKRLQQVENGVGGKILGAPKYATLATMRGEIGMSGMRSRIAGAKLRYVKGIEKGKNELLKKILGEIREDESNR